MRLSRWLLLIGIVVGLGCLQVVQRNALLLQGYAIGERAHRVHEEETAVAWLNAEVDGLASPGRLAQTSRDQRLALVAWAPLSPTQSIGEAVPATFSQPIDRAPNVFSVANVASREAAMTDDTSD